MIIVLGAVELAQTRCRDRRSSARPAKQPAASCPSDCCLRRTATAGPSRAHVPAFVRPKSSGADNRIRRGAGATASGGRRRRARARGRRVAAAGYAGHRTRAPPALLRDTVRAQQRLAGGALRGAQLPPDSGRLPNARIDSEADDAVHKAGRRLSRSNPSSIDNLQSCVTTVVSRVHLNCTPLAAWVLSATIGLLARVWPDRVGR